MRLLHYVATVVQVHVGMQAHIQQTCSRPIKRMANGNVVCEVAEVRKSKKPRRHRSQALSAPQRMTTRNHLPTS